MRSSRCTAGPCSTLPSGAKREPWHGQSQLRSARFQLTWQPRWGHVGETATSVLSKAAVTAKTTCDGRTASEVDAKLKVVRYTLRQVYDEPHRLASEYLGGDFRDFSGEWRFQPAGEGRTHVELDLKVDPGRFVPGPLRGAISDAVMKRALRDLKREAEKHGVPAT